MSGIIKCTLFSLALTSVLLMDSCADSSLELRYGFKSSGYSLSDLTPSGSMSITVAGTIIDKMNITGNVEVRAANVVIKNSKISDKGYWPVRVFSGASLTIEATEIVGASNSEAAIGIDSGGTYSASLLDVHGSADGLRAGSGVVIENCYIHDLSVVSGVTHNDGIQMLSGTNVRISNNYIDVKNGCNSAIIIQTDSGAISDVTISSNYLNGGGYTIFSRKGSEGSIPTGIVITGNRFGRSYQYGLLSADGTPTWSGNVWNDNGASASF